VVEFSIRAPVDDPYAFLPMYRAIPELEGVADCLFMRVAA